MEKFYNIEEQRLWNKPEMWENGGHEWSGPFGNTENLWNKHLFDTLKEFRGKKILEIAPGYGRITQFLSILASELLVIDLNEECIKSLKKRNQAMALITCLIRMYLKEEEEILDSNIILFSFKIRRSNYLQAEMKKLFEISHFLEDL